MTEQEVEQVAEKVYRKMMFNTDYTNHTAFSKQVIVEDGVNIKTGKTNGTMIGTSATEKIGFFGKTPVDQPALASDTLANILAALRELGVISN